MPAADHRDDYFLTRHHAHLLEALDQAVAAGGSLSVIHGETGLGKSRLLQAFIDHRCRGRRWLRLVFLPQGMARIERSGEQEPAHLLQHEMRSRPELACEQTEVWIIDQFELALPHGRDILWQSLAQCGQHPSVIVAGQLQWPEVWRDLLPEQTGALHEAAVRPLDARESRDYLDRYICQDPGRRLRNNRALRRIIRDSRGRIPLLQDAARQLKAADCITIDPIAPLRARWLLILLPILLAAAAACLWLCPDSADSRPLSRNDPPPAREPAPPGTTGAARTAKCPP